MEKEMAVQIHIVKGLNIPMDLEKIYLEITLRSKAYKLIHHDYNVFGGNKLGKYPIAEEVITKCIGKEKFDIARTLYKAYKNIEEPDLLIYKPDYSEIRFAESKRLDTRDEIRGSQVRGLA